jgi:hypothetical protein
MERKPEKVTIKRSEWGTGVMFHAGKPVCAFGHLAAAMGYGEYPKTFAYLDLLAIFGEHFIDQVWVANDGGSGQLTRSREVELIAVFASAGIELEFTE